jgi:hypothetical protein
MRVLIYAACLLSSFTAAKAAQYGETDFRQQSRTCEAATRLPWGDVDLIVWQDCMIHQRARPAEIRRSDDAVARTAWYAAYQKSLIASAHDGCLTWRLSQPSDPPNMHGPGVDTVNHAWNLCMERQGIFVVPPGRTKQESKVPDFRAMAAERRTTTFTFAGAGCQGQSHYSNVRAAMDDLAAGELLGTLPKSKDLDELQQKQRAVIAGDERCRWWSVGERVRATAVDDSVICVSPEGASGACYWTEQMYINAWE